MLSDNLFKSLYLRAVIFDNISSLNTFDLFLIAFLSFQVVDKIMKRLKNLLCIMSISSCGNSILLSTLVLDYSNLIYISTSV